MPNLNNYEVDFTVTGQDKLVAALTASAGAANQAALAVQNLRSSFQSGSGGALRLAGSTRALAQATRQPRQPPTFEKRFSNFVNSSRFSAGGAMPLVGRTAALFGIEAAIFAPAITAVGIFTKALGEASEAGVRFAQLGTQAGSGGQTTGALDTLGISAGQASAFNSRITSDPTAMSLAASLGITNAPGIWGSQDYGKEMLDAIKRVRAIKDPTERLRYARGLGIDDQLSSVSDNRFANMTGAYADTKANIFNPAQQRSAAEFAESLDHMKDAFSGLSALIISPAMDGYTKLFTEIGDIVSGKMTLHRFLTGAGEDKYGNAVDEHTKAIQENTDATNGLTAVMQNPGDYGRGPRRDGAMPGNMGSFGNGNNLRRDMQVGATRLGAFG